MKANPGDTDLHDILELRADDRRDWDENVDLVQAPEQIRRLDMRRLTELKAASDHTGKSFNFRYQDPSQPLLDTLLSSEFKVGNQLFILAVGKWYAVKGSYVDTINEQVDAIAVCVLDWPPHEGRNEAEYNAQVSTIKGVYLFDKKLISFEGEAGRIEFCDLLTEQRQIIHVKKRGQSSNLSHLFMQGYVSAEAFLEYPPLRQEIRRKFPQLRHLIPDSTPIPKDYEIVFAILYGKSPVLPFFSKVAAVGIHKQLRERGFRCSLAWIKSGRAAGVLAAD